MPVFAAVSTPSMFSTFYLIHFYSLINSPTAETFEKISIRILEDECFYSEGTLLPVRDDG